MLVFHSLSLLSFLHLIAAQGDNSTGSTPVDPWDRPLLQAFEETDLRQNVSLQAFDEREEQPQAWNLVLRVALDVRSEDNELVRDAPAEGDRVEHWANIALQPDEPDSGNYSNTTICFAVWQVDPALSRDLDQDAVADCQMLSPECREDLERQVNGEDYCASPTAPDSCEGFEFGFGRSGVNLTYSSQWSQGFYETTWGEMTFGSEEEREERDRVQHATFVALSNYITGEFDEVGAWGGPTGRQVSCMRARQPEPLEDDGDGPEDGVGMVRASVMGLAGAVAFAMLLTL